MFVNYSAAEELLTEYWDALGGKEAALAKTKSEANQPKGGRTPKAVKADKISTPTSATAVPATKYAKRGTRAPSPALASSKKKRRLEVKPREEVTSVEALNEANGEEDSDNPNIILDGSYPPPGTDWATEVSHVESVENDDEGVLRVYLKW